MIGETARFELDTLRGVLVSPQGLRGLLNEAVSAVRTVGGLVRWDPIAAELDPNDPACLPTLGTRMRVVVVA